MNSHNRNKIPAVYLSDETHQAIKQLAKHQNTTMPLVAQGLLEEMQPILQELVNTYDAIKSGKNAQRALGNFVSKSLSLVADELYEDEENDDDNHNEEQKNVTDNGSSN